MKNTTLLICMLAAVLVLPSSATAKEDKDVQPITLGDGSLQLTPPASWTAKKPKFANIVQYEFSVDPADGDKTSGRVTVGGAGGGLSQNKQRWFGQFSQPDGSPTADHAKEEKKEISACTVHLIAISGTYNAPPFDPGGGGPRKNYRMLAAIIDGGVGGSYYLKFYGPAGTVEKNEAAFRKMIESLTKK
ncbi:MAG: hypothetical protein WBF93_09795 [Pirellulales bacterium]